ncbi:MAG: hypothetical protein IKG94_07350 [Candidatus Methanomethylophilaceae archaeon]|nr:hypothetical protein [Candidatus Methanomethylophilaceae archaeon]MBR6205197.1 hypothetical protein [Candidatus Methanomethylophilaceae archaeon]
MLYNHYMGWLYIHYSMMLLETHRYFAAMGAVVNAENLLVHDLYKTMASGDLVAVVSELRKLSEFRDIPRNMSARQRQSIVDEALQFLYSDFLDAINDKKLRILFKVYKEVPERYRDMYVAWTYRMSAAVFEKDQRLVLSDAFRDFYLENPNLPEKYLDVPELSIRDLENEGTFEEKDYAAWVVSCNLALSYLEFVPDLALRYRYVSDDLPFDFHVPELNLMMEDVMETFAHCRFQAYVASNCPSPVAGVAYSFSPMAKRIYSQELLLDVYPRLYSVLDKLSHIVMRVFGIEPEPREEGGYPPQPSYSVIVKEIRGRSGGNLYLETLCEIFDEINPRFIYRTQKGVPFYAMLPGAVHMDSLRHHIIHSGVSLTVEGSGRRSDREMAYVTERELASRCCDLLCLVKEAIMSTCLAIEHRDRRK